MRSPQISARCLHLDPYIMQIAYQDFIPKVLEEKMLNTKYEDLPMVVTRANEWIKSNAIQVINLETVYMPLGENGAGMVDERFTGVAYRLLRVWYKA